MAAAYAAALLLAAMFSILVLLARQKRLPRLVPILALGSAITICGAVGGCGGSKTTAVIPYTPTGTYTLTVHGFVQNASRGFTMTLVVND
jgi:hypothetical protein